MYIFELGAILEVEIKNEEVAKYKTQRGLNAFIQKKLQEFANSIDLINGFEVKYNTPNRFTSYKEVREINDFNYSCYNLCEKNVNYRVYRSFGFNFLVLSEKPDIDYDILKSYLYELNNRKFLVKVSSMGKRLTSKKKCTFIGCLD